VVISVYVAVGGKVSTPEEQIHFSNMDWWDPISRALESEKRFGWKVAGQALLLATLAGWIDEVLQGFLPNRHYDRHDIALNFISALLGLAIYALYPKNPADGKLRGAVTQFVDPGEQGVP